MEVLGSAPDGRAKIGASAWPIPVKSAGLPGLAADRRSGSLGALAEEPCELVVRLAAVLLDTPWAAVIVAIKRSSSRRTCRASTPAEAHRKTQPSAILAARNQALLDWLADDQRFLTAVLCGHTGSERFPARDGRPARAWGRLAGRRPVTADRVDNTHSGGSRDSPAAANRDAGPTADDGSCFRPQWVMLMLNRPVGPRRRGDDRMTACAGWRLWPPLRARQPVTTIDRDEDIRLAMKNQR
jgi:hypothetical protein